MKIKRIIKFNIALTTILVIFLLTQKCFAATTQDKINDIRGQQSEAAKQFTTISEDIGIYEKEVEDLEKKVSSYEKEVNNLSKKVEKINKEVEGLETNLQNVAINYETTKDLLNTRMRVLYENGFVNVFEILFTSSNLNDFFVKYNVLVTLIEHDKKMLEQMKTEKDYIKGLKEDAELRKLQVEQVEYDVEKTKEALETAKTNKENKIKQLNQSKEKLKTLQSKLKKEMAAAEEQLRREMAAAGNYNGSFTGQFYWPVEGSSLLTTYFKEVYDPFGTGAKSHWWGIDLARNKSYTTHIYSIAAGVVISAGPNGGWGNSVVIDHGKGEDGATYRSRYSHLRSISVRKGQTVSRGTTIGIMGTTGNSTGVHLDLSIFRNGAAVDPLKYLTYNKNGSWYSGR